MNYPIDCKTTYDKTEFLYRSQQLLQDLHNQFVKWRESGISQAEYDTLHPELKEAFPYKQKISLSEQKAFIKEAFMPRSEEVMNEICIARNELKEQYKQSSRWNIDVMNLGIVEHQSFLSRVWGFLNKPLF
jgi:hypothetical protein